jgi:twinkle protein
MQTALEYVQQKGLEYRPQGDQLVLQECPFCGNRKSHFYIDRQEGKFFCHICQTKGNLITLQKHLGDYEPRKVGDSGNGKSFRNPKSDIGPAFPEKTAPKKDLDEKPILEAHDRLLNDPEALHYVTDERGISLETVKHFKLGLWVDKEGRWLTIPHYVKGKPLNVKRRSLPPAEKTFRRTPDCPSILFNGDCIGGAKTLFITEGEMDAITLYDQTVRSVVGITAGAGTFHPEWIDQLARIEKIYLIYDPDEAGQKGAREAARRLGYDRCFNVVLPGGQDVNQFFRSHELADFERLASEARQFDVAGIISIEQGFEQLKAEANKTESTGLPTPWPSVNQRIKTGFRPGELIVVSAPPKIGKSSWALQVALFNALQDIPSLFYCLEMRPMKLVKKVIQCQTRKEDPNPGEIEGARRAFSGKPLYFGYCYQRPDLTGIIGTIKEAVKRYGLKLVVFDHLHFLCRSVTNQTQEIGLAVQDFKFLAEEMEIPVILIAQPRKIQPDSMMTAMDLKDSISIFSDCDHLIILHRKRLASKGKDVSEGMETQEQSYSPVTLARVEASRYSAGGEATLYYHGEYSRFDEVELARKEKPGNRDFPPEEGDQG